MYKTNDPHVRLMIGQDVLDYYGATDKALKESDAKWNDLSLSAACDDIAPGADKPHSSMRGLLSG